MPDGYVQRNGKRYGYYEDENGNRHFYKSGNDIKREISKTKANADSAGIKERMENMRGSSS